MARPIRSALYLPASNARALDKVRSLPCDAVILDLEDAVAPAHKTAARAAAVAAVAQGGFGDRVLVVRGNGLDTAWGADDCAALAGARPDAVLIPKVDQAADVDRYRARLPGLPLWAMIETPGAVLRLDAIAGADGLAALVVGTNDLATALRMRLAPDRAQLQGFLAHAAAAARAHGRMALDGVCNALDDPARFAAECEQGAALGFDGKTLIHPSQIEPCRTAFAPGDADIARARAIVAAFAAAGAGGQGAIRLHGEMVERLHLAAAEDLLRRCP